MIALSRNGYLKNALLLDAAASGTMALLLLLGAGPLAGMLGFDAAFLRWVGLFLVAYSAFVAWSGSAVPVPRAAVMFIISANVVWVIASLLLLVSSWVDPTALGYAFVIVQAAAVALFAELQIIGMRRETAV